MHLKTCDQNFKKEKAPNALQILRAIFVVMNLAKKHKYLSDNLVESHKLLSKVARNSM